MTRNTRSRSQLFVEETAEMAAGSLCHFGLNSRTGPADLLSTTMEVPSVLNSSSLGCRYPLRQIRPYYWCSCFYMVTNMIVLLSVVHAQQFVGDEKQYVSSIFQPLARDESLSFDRGGTRPRCWNATGFQALLPDGDGNSSSTGDSMIYQAKEMTLNEFCSPKVQINVQVIEVTTTSKRKWDTTVTPKQRLTSSGWEISSDLTLTVLVEGTWGDSLPTIDDESMQTAVVVQLCLVGMNSQCPPLIPSPPYESTESLEAKSAFSPFTRRRRRELEEPGGSAVDEAEMLGTLVNFEFLSIRPEEGGAFAGELSLSGAPAGTYSLLGSVIIFGPNHQFAGASIIPMNHSQEQLITVVQQSSDTAPYSVQDWAVKCVISLSVIGSVVVLFLLIQFYGQRKSQVFELTQGKFILAMHLSGLVATCSLVLVEPKNDLYCKLYQPFITLPMHIMFSILVGRMWRIRAIISPLLLLTLEKKEHWTTRWINVMEWITRMEGLGERVTKMRGKKKIRRAITDGQLLRVILLMCLPQVIVQILILTIGDQQQIIAYGKKINEKEDEAYVAGYETCKETYFNTVLGILSFTFLVGIFVTLLILAGTSRSLPSLFNETRSMLDVAVTTTRMTFLGGMLIVATHTYPSAGTVQFLVFAVLVGVTIVHTCLRITWPKIIMAQSGSKIIVTKLISAHNDKGFKAKTYEGGSSGLNSDNQSFYGISMLTGITLPSTQSGMTSSTSRRRHNSSKADPHPSQSLISSDTTPDAAGRGKANLLQMGDEDGESSTSIRALKEGHSRKKEPINSKHTSDREEGEDAQSSDSSVFLLMDTEVKDRVRGNSLFSTGTINRTHHLRTQNYASGQSLSSASFASFKWNASERSLTSRVVDVITGAQGPDGWGSTAKNARALSRRGLFQRHSAEENISENPALVNEPSGVPSPAVPPTSGPQGFGTKMSLLPKMLRQMSARGSKNSVEMPRTQTMVPLTIEFNPKHATVKIRVAEEEPPPRRLLLRMIDLQRMLGKANNNILAGLCVNVQDWEEMSDACVALGNVFAREVEFEWQRDHHQDVEDPFHELNDSGEVNMEDYTGRLPVSPNSSHPVSPNSGHQATSGLLQKKQLSWKPGLITASSEGHTEDLAVFPSILRHHKIAEEEGSDLSSVDGDEHNQSGQKMQIYSETSDANETSPSMQQKTENSGVSLEAPEPPGIFDESEN